MDLNGITLNTDFLSSDEMEALTKDIVEQANNHPEADSERIYHVMYVCHVMKELNKANKSAKVSFELFSPYKSMGIVSVVGRNLEFKNSELFMRAIELASNFEVYPKTDGTVVMNFTFHGLMRTGGSKIEI